MRMEIDNIQNLCVIVAAVYIIARIIVAVTPTPKDDEALKKVNVLLRTVAKAIGLDLKQGINIKEKKDVKENVTDN
jgi:hypothetical protein